MSVVAEFFTDLQVFDPETLAWSDLSESYSSPDGHVGPRPAIFGDGKFYLLGRNPHNTGTVSEPRAAFVESAISGSGFSEHERA